MGRPKKDAKYLNVYIEKSIYDRFEQLCYQLGQSKTVAAERALLSYINSVDNQHALQNESEVQHNDR